MQIRVSLSGEEPTAKPLQELDGVGLLRGEFIFRARGEYITIKAALDELQGYLERTCLAFSPRPIWYRLCDFWSDEANVLIGNNLQEEEGNPIVGLRGIRRGLAAPDTLRRELAAVAEVAMRFDNLHVLFPFVQDADELAEGRRFLEEIRWPNRFGTMLEIPSAVFEATRFVEAGASNLLVGMNDLTCLLLGRERGSPALKLHRAVWWAIDHLAASLPINTEWGIGGSLTQEILAEAQLRGVPYVTLHYADLPHLLNTDPGDLPDLNLVRVVKTKTQEMKRIRKEQLRG